MAQQKIYLLVVLGKAVSEPTLHLLSDIDEHCFGGMFRELVGLTDVHWAARAAQTRSTGRIPSARCTRGKGQKRPLFRD